MAKKIFDIIPPHLVSDAEEKVKNFVVGKKSKKKIKKERKNRSSSRFRIIIISLGILIILLAIYLYFKLASLNVIIWPNTEDINFEDEITAENSLSAIDLQNKKIPAQVIEEEKELWQEFEATGSNSEEGKAGGTIKVYNKYSPAKAVSLVSGTRFLSDSGKYFRSVSKVSIPAVQVKGGKTVPGSIDVKVVAIESGEDYNIDPSKFSVPGLAGTSMYYSIYAESNSKMTGGFKSTSKVVTAEDIENAKGNLTKKLLDDATADIKNKASSAGLILFDGALSKNIIETSSSVKAGAEVDKFNYKVKLKVSGLVFKDVDLKDFAKGYILSQILPSKTFLEKSLSVKYTLMTIDSSAGKITLNLEISGKTYPTIDLKNLSSQIPQKSSEEIREIIYNAFSQQVSQLKINLWPFWVKKAPKNQRKIKIELIFE